MPVTIKNIYKDDGVCSQAIYLHSFEKWVESDYCHEKVRAVYEYLKKSTLIQDLVAHKIIKLNEENQIDEKENIQGIPQPKAFVRFIIRFASLINSIRICDI